MSFYVSDGYGETVDNPSPRSMRDFLEKIDPTDEEHGAAWLSDDSDRSLEMSFDGTLTYNAGDAPPCHLARVHIDKVLELWLKLAEGRIAELESEPWQPGTRPPLSAEQAAERERTIADALRAEDRKFYDLLGPEREEVPCRHAQCSRGAIDLSVFCRVHHFESLRGRPSPFDD